MVRLGSLRSLTGSTRHSAKLTVGRINSLAEHDPELLIAIAAKPALVRQPARMSYVSGLTKKDNQYRELLTAGISVIGSLLIIGVAMHASSHAYSRRATRG